MSATVTNEPTGESRSDGAESVAQLVLVMHADRPTAAPAHYTLAGLDEVQLGRGEPRVERAAATLRVRLPDPRMSEHHTRLIRRGVAWRLEDAGAKNGCMVNGRRVRDSALYDGDLVELGHTFFRFRIAPAWRLEAELPPELATFDGELAATFARLQRMARADVPLLVLGETGTGKEVAARAFHQMSRRRGPFVAVNCGALPESLIEAELFGARKGAYSGGVADRPGLVRSADGGTLFLDELAELDADSQAALLRVLQEREVTPIGDTQPIKVDVRICAATHRALDEMVAAGTFRRDLHARVRGFTLALPALRDRRHDLGLMARAILLRLPGGAVARFTMAAARALHGHDWPYNVRELEHVLGQAVALAGDRPIELADLGALTPRAPAPLGAGDDALEHALVELLERHRGNIAAVAREVGKDRMQVHRWIRRFALDLAAYRR